jgi:hypothetical protein
VPQHPASHPHREREHHNEPAKDKVSRHPSTNSLRNTSVQPTSAHSVLLTG